MTETRARDDRRATPRKRMSLERHYVADLEEIWSLWTTREGFESWWGPGGFAVTVRSMDLRPGGDLVYAMTAVGAREAEFMRQAGMPLTTEARLTYTEVVRPRRLAYVHLTDFIPGVEPYDVATVVELHRTHEGVRMVVTFDTMHSDEWTERAVMGWEGQLAKLDTRFRGAGAGGTP